MTAKEYLSQARLLATKITRAEEQILAMRTEIEGVKAIRYDKVRVQTSPNPDTLADYLAKIEEAEGRARALKLEYIETYEKIRRQIDTITPPLYQQVLAYRYLDGWSLSRIARKLNYTDVWIRKVHGWALLEFARQHMSK